MTAIEPGEPFTVTYRDGKKQLTAHGLSFRDMRNVAKVEDRLTEAKGSEQYEILEQAVRAALPKWSDDEVSQLLDEVTLTEVSIIFAQLMGRLTPEDKKKYDTPDLSETENSANPARHNVESMLVN